MEAKIIGGDYKGYFLIKDGIGNGLQVRKMHDFFEQSLIEKQIVSAVIVAEEDKNIGKEITFAVELTGGLKFLVVGDMKIYQETVAAAMQGNNIILPGRTAESYSLTKYSEDNIVAERICSGCGEKGILGQLYIGNTSEKYYHEECMP